MKNLEDKYILPLANKLKLHHKIKLLCKYGLKEECENIILDFAKNKDNSDYSDYSYIYTILYEFHLTFDGISDKIINKLVEMMKYSYKRRKAINVYCLIKVLILLMFLNDSDELYSLFITIDENYKSYNSMSRGFGRRDDSAINIDSRILTKPSLWNLLNKCNSIKGIYLHFNVDHVIHPDCEYSPKCDVFLNKEISEISVHQIASITPAMNDLIVHYKIFKNSSAEFRKYINNICYCKININFGKKNHADSFDYYPKRPPFTNNEDTIIPALSYMKTRKNAFNKILLNFNIPNEKILESYVYRKGDGKIHVKYYSNKSGLSKLCGLFNIYKIK
jgi:hypothetical protein